MKTATSKLYIVVVVIALLIYVTCIVWGSFSIGTRDSGFDITRDIVNATEVTENEFEISPASWAFAIWFPIYVWQAVFFLYCILSFFPKFKLRPVPLAVFPFYILNSFCGVGWGIMSERNWYWPGVGLIAGLPVTMYICLAISVYKLHKKECRYWVYTYMVHNAFAIYSGWTTVATLLYLGIAMIHGSPAMGQQITGTIMLGILMAELVIFCSLELTVWDKYLRHVWTHYIPLAVAASGIIVKNWNPENRNSIMTVAIAGFVACAFSLKMAKMLSRCSRPDKPDYLPRSEKSDLKDQKL